MAELTTRDGVRVEPGTELYWLEPGTTQVLGSPTYTRDVAMTRWSSPKAAIAAARDQAEVLKADARDQYEAGYKRWNRHDDFQRLCVTLLDAIEYTGGVEVTAVPPADKPEECR